MHKYALQPSNGGTPSVVVLTPFQLYYANYSPPTEIIYLVNVHDQV